MHIYIPTYRRTDRQLTLQALPLHWRKKTTLVCDMEDAKYLKPLGATMLVAPKNIHTIAAKRAWILRTTPYQRIIMLDDDLRFSKRVYAAKYGEGIPKLEKAGEQAVDMAMGNVEEQLRTLAHAGISPRQMNNQGSKGALIAWEYNARCIYALGFNVAKVRKHCELGRIEHREDMDYTLQLLTQGFSNAIYLDTCVDQVYNSPGGASLDRNVEYSNADAERLAKLFPGLVKVAEKAYLTSVPRKEVVVSWKKAYAQGLQLRNNKGK